jgi:ABC-type uncharacterized transport system involved in gliding motility auxiliary subunit
MLALQAENFRVEDLSLMNTGAVPENTLVLIISGPQKDFFPVELDKINQYLKTGGKVLFLCDPSPLPNIEEFLKKSGIKISHDFVIDRGSKLLGLDSLSPIITLEKHHSIAKDMNEAVVFPVCRSVMPADGHKNQVLARSGSDSWAEHDTESVYDSSAEFDRSSDIHGPVPVAVLTKISAKDKLKSGILIVMGNSNFVANHYFNVLGNKDFFLNTVNWLAGKKGALSTRTKKGTAPVAMLFLTEKENRAVLWLCVFIEPGLILLAGFFVIAWRRRKR